MSSTKIPKLDPELNLQEFVTFQVIQTSQLLTREGMHTLAGKFGITMPQWRILARLGVSGTLSVMQVVEDARMDKGLTSRIVRQLEDRKLVRLQQDQRDRRVVNLSLTRAGRALYDRMKVVAQARQDELQQGVSAADRKTLFKVLARLRDNANARLARERDPG